MVSNHVFSNTVTGTRATEDPGSVRTKNGEIASSAEHKIVSRTYGKFCVGVVQKKYIFVGFLPSLITVRLLDLMLLTDHSDIYADSGQSHTKINNTLECFMFSSYEYKTD